MGNQSQIRLNQVYKIVLGIGTVQFIRIKSVRLNDGDPYYGISFLNSKDEDIQVTDLFFNSRKVTLLNEQEAKLVRTLFSD